MNQKKLTLIGTIFLLLATTGCNRATLRVYGASTEFPQTVSGYIAKARFPGRLVVELPQDDRARYYGEKVDGTNWKGCSTDALWGKDAAAQLIQQRLVQEFSASGLFPEVTTNAPTAGDVVLKTDIDAFCSQVVGFLYDRAAGICSLQISLERDGKVLVNQKFEKVVTDADPEYTGSQVTFIEQAMRVTMADSLRVTLENLLEQCDSAAGSASQPEHAASM